MARELHDNINQILATIKVYLQLAGQNESISPELINKSYENVSSAIEEVRKLSKALAPPTLEDSTLTESLEQLVNDMVLSSRFDIKFISDDFDESLPDNAQKMALYRIAQEQFTNILKYSGAQKVIITLCTNDNEVNLSIEDDGAGFDTNNRATGIGIRNMMNRAESHNGQFNLISSPGNGCRIKVSLPLTKTYQYERH